jgi:hypothetical protein
MNSGAAERIDLAALPDWLDPMVVKELRQALQEKWFLIPFVLIHGLMIVALGMEWAQLQEGKNTQLRGEVFWWVAYAMIGVLMPLRSFNALEEESRQGNMELLMMAGLSRWQIMRGKWFVQTSLTGLVLTSLLPYVLVRYFFGAYEFWENFVLLLTLLGLSLSSSALLLGISGYRNYFMRIVLCALSLLYLIPTTAGGIAFANVVGRDMGSSRFTIATGAAFLGIVGIFTLCILAGLQLGRAHLKLYLVPWEPTPTRTIVSMFIFMPIIIGAGSILTWGFGGLVIEAILIYVFLSLDSQHERPQTQRH